MKPATIFVFLAAAAGLWLACGGNGAAPVTSGIEGQVLLGPACPVVREDTPCPDQPFQATIVIWNADRSEKIRTFTTDEEGRFRVPLAPGEYHINPQPPSPGRAADRHSPDRHRPAGPVRSDHHPVRQRHPLACRSSFDRLRMSGASAALRPARPAVELDELAGP